MFLFFFSFTWSNWVELSWTEVHRIRSEPNYFHRPTILNVFMNVLIISKVSSSIELENEQKFLKMRPKFSPKKK